MLSQRTIFSQGINNFPTLLKPAISMRHKICLDANLPMIEVDLNINKNLRN